MTVYIQDGCVLHVDPGYPLTVRGRDGERMEVLDGAVVPCVGPQPERGGVMRLRGAV